MNETEEDRRHSVTCPKCGEAFFLHSVAHFAPGQTMKFKMTPGPRGMMDMATVGGTLAALSKFLKSCAVDVGGRVLPSIERTETTESGEIIFHVVCADVEPRNRA